MVGGLAALSLAAHVHSRWLGRAPFAAVYGAVLAAVATFSVWALGADRMLSGPPSRVALSILAGVAAGAVAWWSDRTILRALRRRRRRSPPIGRHTARPAPAPRNLRVAGAASGARRRRLGTRRVQERGRAAIRIEGLVQLATIGALEELDYRGALVGACFLVPSTALRTAALAASVAAFALSHIWFGWPHVAAKVPLGVLTMAAALVAGSVVPAVVAHVVFNFAVARALRNESAASSSRARPAWLGTTPAL